MGWAAEQARAVYETLHGAFAGDGIVAAVAAIDPGGPPAIVTSEGVPPDGRFEIGSVTKTMTGTLLATLVGDGTVTLDDRVGRWLDAGANADITVGELATHTSGLPRLAPNQPTGIPNPYRDFTAERAEQGLRAVTRNPEQGHVYSNFGYQLLGLVLERASGRSYRDLLAERLLEPLGMTSSGVGADGGGTRLTGYAAGQPAGHWDHALPGPGAVEASIRDLARYMSACLSPPDGPLGVAIRLCQQPRVQMDERRSYGLGWVVETGRGLVWHNGGTGGFSASVGLRQADRRALGALVNIGGRSAPVLDGAVQAALTGADAGRMRPQPTGDAPGPEWEARARETARALLDGRFGDVYEKLLPEAQGRVSAAQLAKAWSGAARQAGTPGAVSVSCRAVPGGVGALVTIDCAERPLSLLLTYAESERIVMMRVLPPGERAPWLSRLALGLRMGRHPSVERGDCYGSCPCVVDLRRVKRAQVVLVPVVHRPDLPLVGLGVRGLDLFPAGRHGARQQGQLLSSGSCPDRHRRQDFVMIREECPDLALRRRSHPHPFGTSG